MIAAFGDRAERYARGLPELDAIVCDPRALPRAYMEAVKRRSEGRSFYVQLLYDDPRCTFAADIAHRILANVVDHDERLKAFHSLADGTIWVNGKTARENWAVLETQFGQELFSLADGMLVRSFSEHVRLGMYARRSRPLARVLATATLPKVPARRPGMSVVIWAPHRAGAELALEAFALAEFPGPVTVVCSDGRLDPLPVLRFVTVDDPGAEDALAAAGVVVCPDHGDASEAVAFAQAGFAIAAPETSGVVEYVAGVATYDSASVRSLWDAVAIAFGRPTGAVHLPPPPPISPGIPELPVESAGLPLASVIVPTYNRREDLARVLDSLEAQTYPNIEVVVVNDAGAGIDDIVAQHARARLVEQAVNGGPIRASMAGFRAARGTFIQFLADDDVLYPDHLQRLIAAMLRNDAAAAHGNTLIRYQKLEPDGQWKTNGFNAIVFNESATPSDALISTPISGQAMCIRRDVFERIGAWREDTFLADQEFQFRLWRTYPSVWVDHMTNEWTVREKTNFSAKVENAAAELARIFNEYHPVEGRPLIATYRSRTLDNVASRPPGAIFPATLLLP